MNTNFNIGKRILELRTNLGLSQEQLALQAEITTTYLGQLEHNKKHPTVHVIEKICSCIDISLQEFFSTDEYIPKHDLLTDQLLINIKDCTDDEKLFMISMCKHLKELRVPLK